MALPIPTSKPSQTLVGRRNLVTITPDGGSPISIHAVSMQFECTRETLDREAPTNEADSILFVDRRIPTRRADAVIITLDEWNEDLIALATGDSHVCTFLAQAVDPGAETGYLSMRFSKANGDAVAGLCHIEGDTTLDREQLSTYQLRLTATEDAVYKPEFEVANVTGDGEIELIATFASGAIYADDDNQTAPLVSEVGLSIDAESAGNRVRLFGDFDRITALELALVSATVSELKINLTQLQSCAAFVGIEQVTELEVSPIANAALSFIDLPDSPMTAANINKLFRQLPDRSATTQGDIVLSGAANIGSADTSIATAKNWDVIT